MKDRFLERGAVMRINIVEKGPFTFYGIANSATVESEFDKFWDKYYDIVSKDYATPIGYSTSPNEEGIFTYYTCIQNSPQNKDLFKEVHLPKTTFAIFELKGAVTKTIPIAWKFAKENFVISDMPSIEVYSTGNRLDKNYRMDLWIPISEVLPSYQKNNGLLGKMKRGLDNAVDGVIEFSKSETGQLTFTLGGALLVAAGLTLFVSNASEDKADYPLNDEHFDSDTFVVDAIEEYEEIPTESSTVSHNYPVQRAAPITHLARRGDTVYIRGGTAEEKQRFREENNLDF
ncbi:TPA: GyrI-like domain-containing protein [Streptococcus suis]